MTAGGGHVAVLEKLWDWAKELQLKPDELRNEVLLSKDKYGQMAWHMAEAGGHVEVLEKTWDWVEELKLAPNELKKMFLSVDKDGNNTANLATSTGSKELLDKTWTMCKETQHSDDLSKLLVAAWHDAAARGYLEILERLWLCAGKVQLNTQELQRRLLLDENRDGEN